MSSASELDSVDVSLPFIWCTNQMTFRNINIGKTSKYCSSYSWVSWLSISNDPSLTVWNSNNLPSTLCFTIKNHLVTIQTSKYYLPTRLENNLHVCVYACAHMGVHVCIHRVIEREKETFNILGSLHGPRSDLRHPPCSAHVQLPPRNSGNSLEKPEKPLLRIQR